MSLTKRLYRLDEVRAAFLYCLKQRRFNETIFWLRELEDSCYGGEARRLLFVSWFMCIGLARISWLVEWSFSSFTREGRLKLCWQVMRCSERDSSLWWLLWCGSGSVNISNGFSKLLDKWRSRQYKLDDARFNGLEHDMRGYSLFADAVQCALDCVILPKSCWAELSTNEPVDLQKMLEEWSEFDRLYEIPYMCLYGMTWRGCGGDTTEELNQCSLTSPYWKARALFTTDSEKEDFYDTYFPNDIPDEWSLKEKLKSHGSGVDCSNGAPLSRWWRSWISPDHLWIWGKPVRLCWEWVLAQQANVEASVIDRLIMIYKDIPIRPYCSQKKVFQLEA